jgi:hypothetical protein
MRRLPNALLQYRQPSDPQGAVQLIQLWRCFRHFVTGRGRHSLSEVRRQELTKDVLGDFFGVPKSQWHRFTRIPALKRITAREILNAIAALKVQSQSTTRTEGHAKKPRQPRPKPTKPKLTKVLVRRYAQSQHGEVLPTEVLLIPIKAKH